ncbi:MAG: DUF2760 domain-containing protein [Desulfosoma sp.]|uniref:DUF2760 domain-containing protein n=1 Tax=Desulfosoma sp. TaxID=2603217 RepID=UPI004049C448
MTTRRITMQLKSKFTLQTFIASALFQGVVLAAFFWIVHQGLQSFLTCLQPFGGNQGAMVPSELMEALRRLENLLQQARHYAPWVIFGLGGLGTLFLWIVVQAMGRRAITEALGKASAPAASAQAAVFPQEYATSEVLPSDMDPKSVGAVQMLSVLQRQGRFIDFLQEDLSRYDDAQIGAAVRTIHESCKSALIDCVQLEAVMVQEEGALVTVPSGFDPAAIRLTGHVVGDPPFRGVLRHRGWRVRSVHLPKLTAQTGKERIVAPAEVEITEAA